MLLIVGLLQLSMASVFLLHRGFSSFDIWQAVQPMFAIWIFMWPVYQSVTWIWFGLLLLLCLLLAAGLIHRPFWHDLRKAWSPRLGGLSGEQLLHAPLSFFCALLISVILIDQGMPEFGFAVALASSLAFPLARLVDRLAIFPLFVSLHPEHTLAGHVALLLSMTLLCTWSIHAYHGVDSLLILPSATMAAALCSMMRMLLPQWWNLPLSMLAASILLWLL